MWLEMFLLPDDQRHQRLRSSWLVLHIFKCNNDVSTFVYLMQLNWVKSSVCLWPCILLSTKASVYQEQYKCTKKEIWSKLGWSSSHALKLRVYKTMGLFQRLGGFCLFFCPDEADVKLIDGLIQYEYSHWRCSSILPAVPLVHNRPVAINNFSNWVLYRLWHRLIW